MWPGQLTPPARQCRVRRHAARRCPGGAGATASIVPGLSHGGERRCCRPAAARRCHRWRSPRCTAVTIPARDDRPAHGQLPGRTLGVVERHHLEHSTSARCSCRRSAAGSGRRQASSSRRAIRCRRRGARCSRRFPRRCSRSRSRSRALASATRPGPRAAITGSGQLGDDLSEVPGQLLCRLTVSCGYGHRLDVVPDH